MPLPVPNLDDRTFEQLVDEARALIPRNLPAWTDHNPSDPGVTLMELFAFLIEAAIYQINRVPERSLENFAKLVGAPRKANEPISATLRRALDELAKKSRAITAADFELLIANEAKGFLSSSPSIARAKVFVATVDTPNVFPKDQIVQVIIVPNEPNNPAPIPTAALRQKVFEFLRACSLVTTRVRVMPPSYREVKIETTVVRDHNSRLGRETVQRNVEQALRNFLSPLTGGVDGKGWEFGRKVFRSELYQVIEGVAGVDHAQRLLLNGDEDVGEFPTPPTTPPPTTLMHLDELSVEVVEQ